MKRVPSVFTPPCPPPAPAACARRRCSWHPISRATARYPCAFVRSSNATHDLVEPLSLDEAYLDVTRNKRALASATEVARYIRAEIEEETRLTASAGVAPNKFLAKIASDWRKPDGLFVIQPHAVLDFLAPLAVRKLPGVGPATDTMLRELGVVTVADLRTRPVAELETRFGRFGRRLYNLARGVDNNVVSPDRPRKSLSAETTFDRDLALGEIGEIIDSLAERVWQQAENADRVPHTVVIKLKTSDFRIITRSLTPARPPGTRDELTTDRATPARQRRFACVYSLPPRRRRPGQFPRARRDHAADGPVRVATAVR